MLEVEQENPRHASPGRRGFIESRHRATAQRARLSQSEGIEDIHEDLIRKA
jgi:hypothetical protein